MGSSSNGIIPWGISQFSATYAKPNKLSICRNHGLALGHRPLPPTTGDGPIKTSREIEKPVEREERSFSVHASYYFQTRK